MLERERLLGRHLGVHEVRRVPLAVRRRVVAVLTRTGGVVADAELEGLPRHGADRRVLAGAGPDARVVAVALRLVGPHTRVQGGTGERVLEDGPPVAGRHGTGRDRPCPAGADGDGPVGPAGLRLEDRVPGPVLRRGPHGLPRATLASLQPHRAAGSWRLEARRDDGALRGSGGRRALLRDRRQGRDPALLRHHGDGDRLRHDPGQPDLRRERARHRPEVGVAGELHATEDERLVRCARGSSRSRPTCHLGGAAAPPVAGPRSRACRRWRTGLRRSASRSAGGAGRTPRGPVPARPPSWRSRAGRSGGGQGHDDVRAWGSLGWGPRGVHPRSADHPTHPKSVMARTGPRRTLRRRQSPPDLHRRTP